MPSSIAIVILNYNGAHYLRKVLPSVIRHSPGQRVIVADNASEDDSVSILQKEFPEVEIIQLPQNFGFAGGYNEALKEVESKYFLLLNSDVEVTAGWLDPMLRLLEDFPEIAACQPKILSWHQQETFEYAGASGGYLDILGYPFCRGRIFDTLEKDEGQYNEAVPVFWASGACMLIRAGVFRKAGGFDPHFFAHMEEIDLCWRIHRSGYKVFVCPESVVFHVGGGTLAKDNPRKTFLNFRNSLWMLYKNSSAAELRWKLPTRFALDLLAALQFLIKGKPFIAKAVLESQYAFWRFRPSLSGRAKAESENAPVYKGVILWDYFGRRKRKFSELKYITANKGIVQNIL